ncbi:MULTISPECIES: ribulose bisphosphate carboxylase small subunit [unclassified Paraburkholderia]|uniref:ribulose bisphosphate carboxylase small subunit n=1 Tax=unclassified Paraburkholderia TaxID=2615204 RepID=UPI00161C6944|nr:MULTISPECIES: ribulose bisphosphate carboxylase small subunit [unclassified Paraburkholderia]MBB5413122.1 ribulose-bisphosphate carboxylase small chain [Paraburkholderia sp. HC6.4b]MBB5450299.1 ribulose-bisphosphate carboxylase small chain [Paraburkholderia sp. Kb1A]
MRITQGTFSFLPELTDEEIGLQIDYALRQGWACSVEFTDDPHPRNTYWEMWGLPMFDLHDAAGVLQEVRACREARPQHYIKVNAFDSVRTFETMRLSFIVNRPDGEPGFRLLRQDAQGRTQRYSMTGYAGDRPAGERYGAAG